ncbi:efflux RND transporter permease subunit [Trichlorobacter ammonificans]|uniref:Multidrug efflux pump RND permease subunit MdtB n=1 Tax=Trichlorobacter ammonificans TaxID=2916410 RepID=A0ABM9D642_9BACT|nr:efflux RND transporter permease subunit [Trichlorobacter ammonificans]CAH2030615.1 multidrug efflux pump RND permease subunit MdtB [Trichlorobacter ammonificans]
MNISEPFIRRPIATSLVMLAIMVFGMLAYRGLPVNDLPTVDFPTIQVRSDLAGASPETMASAVATPLEREFSTIAGLDSMTSTNGQGLSIITLKFTLKRDIDAAALDVQAAIAKAMRQLPPDMATPPSYRKVNPADSPVLYIALNSATMPLHQVNEYADTMLAQRISMVSGVAQVLVYGSQKYAARVQVDPRQLASRGIGIDEVATALSRANSNLPTGTLQGPKQALTIQTNGPLLSAEAFRPAIVAWKNGSPVRVQDLGTAIDSVENDKVAAWYNRKEFATRAIILAVQRQPGANTIEMVDAIKALLPEFQSQLPAALQMNVLYDRTVSIRESVDEVKFTLVLTIGLVIMVIFLFLRNLPATIIPSLAVPLSIVGTFAVMYGLGISINNISLLALTLSIGFVVDDAIVMLENIVRHIENGEKPMAAALRGAKEIGFTIVSMTISLVAVFIPVLFMGGMLGRLLNEFAITISAAILISGFVSLTLTPMMCSRFLKQHDATQRHGRLYLFMERFFDRLRDGYDISLQWVLRHRRAVLVFTVVSGAITVGMFMRMPAGLFSSEDTGGIFGITEGVQGISFEEMMRNQQLAAEIVRQNPNVEAFMSSAGASGSRVGSNSGFMFIRLKPLHQRRDSADEVIQQLRPKLAKLPGIQVFLQNPPPIRLEATLAKAQYQFALMSPDTDTLYKAAAEFEARLKNVPILQDVTSDLQIRNPELKLVIDRDRAAALGVSAQQVEDVLYYAYGSRQVSTIFAPSNQYRVILEVEPKYQQDASALSLLYVRSSGGQLVPLSTLVSPQRTVGPLSVNHLGQSTAVTISFNIRPGVPLGEATATVEQEARTLPAGITTAFQGTAQAFQQSFKGLSWLLIAAIAVIYIVLGVLYESYIHPLTILSGLPSAGLGALLTLLLFGHELNLYAFVGIILLVGIVKKNAIMMIDFALEAQRSEGTAPLDAIYRGALIRFRPIMMTTMAALMGALPIALGIGAGAAARRPLGLAVVGGLIVSQILTLYITPVVYYYLDLVQRRLMEVRRREVPHGERVHPTAS